MAGKYFKKSTSGGIAFLSRMLMFNAGPRQAGWKLLFCSTINLMPSINTNRSCAFGASSSCFFMSYKYTYSWIFCILQIFDHAHCVIGSVFIFWSKKDAFFNLAGMGAFIKKHERHAGVDEAAETEVFDKMWAVRTSNDANKRGAPNLWYTPERVEMAGRDRRYSNPWSENYDTV